MILRFLLFIAALGVPTVLAQALPDLGDVSAATISVADEQRLGEHIMREIRRDPAYYDDPEVTDYTNSLGLRLTSGVTAETRQAFDFFVIRDPQINAFAMPGGFIGVHTGLILAAQSESEVAGVLGHEIAHVTQRHIARMINQQGNNQLMSLAAMAVALLAARSNSQVAEAAFAFGQAGAIQNQLNFTRSNEREADRVGVQILERSGFDPRGMEVFFERMQRATRVYETGAPSYLRTHPLTFERIADIQSRLESMPYRQVADSLEFQLIRAKLRAELGAPHEALAFFESSLGERKYLSELASRYGLVASLIRNKLWSRARQEMVGLRKTVNPIVENLGCQLEAASGNRTGALQCFVAARRLFPNYRALFYGHLEQLLWLRQAAQALSMIEEGLQTRPDDSFLYQLQAEAYAALGKPLMQHRALAEAYLRRGQLGAAVEQLQIALKSGGGDFYILSATESRLRELRRQLVEQKRQPQRF
jgi:beta-barrel assembly-enhancing protease